MPIIVQTTPLKIQRKNGFHRQHIEKTFDHAPTLADPDRKIVVRKQCVTQRVPGGLYIVFECPACAKRNKQAVRRAVETRPSALTFVCNGCSIRVSVEGGVINSAAPKIIVP